MDKSLYSVYVAVAFAVSGLSVAGLLLWIRHRFQKTHAEWQQMKTEHAHDLT